MTAAQDEKTIPYDHDELSKALPEYRDFVLRAACARNAGMSAAEADCAAVKRLRDEKNLPKEKVALVAQGFFSKGVENGRAQTLLACFEAWRN